MAFDALPHCVDSLRQCVVLVEETARATWWSATLLGLAGGLAVGLLAGLWLSDWLDARLDRLAYQRQFQESGDATPL